VFAIEQQKLAFILLSNSATYSTAICLKKKKREAQLLSFKCNLQ
jgi:hypothetical protein